MNLASRPEKGFSLVELLVVVTIVGVIASIAIPRLLVTQKRAHATSAVALLRTISTAEALYHQQNGRYADMVGLSNAGQLSDLALGSGIKSGYLFAVTATNAPAPGFSATATPLDPSPVTLYYFVDETGVIRSAAGAPATAASPPIQ